MKINNIFLSNFAFKDLKISNILIIFVIKQKKHVFKENFNFVLNNQILVLLQL